MIKMRDTNPSAADLRLQNYNIFLKHAKKICIFCADLLFLGYYASGQLIISTGNNLLPYHFLQYFISPTR